LHSDQFSITYRYFLAYSYRRYTLGLLITKTTQTKTYNEKSYKLLPNPALTPKSE